MPERDDISSSDLNHVMKSLATVHSQVDGLDLGGLAAVFTRSGYFPDATALSQATVKLIAGKELGLGAMASMQGISLINGRPNYSSNVLAALLQRTERFRYRVSELTNERCSIVFFEHWGPAQAGEWVEIGTSTFTIKDAEQAGLLGKNPTYKLYPRNMLWARAMSNGVKWFAPILTNGVEIGDPIDEIVDDTGQLVDRPAPPMSREEIAAGAARYTEIHGTDDDEEGIPVRLPKSELWRENRRLSQRAAELGLRDVAVLNSRSSEEEIAAANAQLLERIENLEIDQTLAQETLV